jgi:hypothetical protein
MNALKVQRKTFEKSEQSLSIGFYMKLYIFRESKRSYLMEPSFTAFMANPRCTWQK